MNGDGSLSHATSPSILQRSPAIRPPASSIFSSSGVQQVLHPLRRTADRVTRQMDAFAEKLDRFKQQDRTQGSYQAAFSLIKNYQLHASDAINEATRQSTLKRAKLGWNASREADLSTATSEEDLQRLQLEIDTWDILLNLIAVDDPTAISHAKEAQKSVFQNLHRYSTDREVWEQFLDADQHATECVMVMKWLETKAKSSAQQLDSVIANLEAQAERGTGLWAHGWLYTKESIKGQKRLRAWPQPLEPNDPGLLASLLSSEKQEPLITQLDPDAVIRQKHALQKQDQYYEQATWLTCWKMLRQGETWTKIREWSQERLESWRAVSLCGSSVDQDGSGGRLSADDSMTRMMNCRSQDAWRSACSALARNPSTNDYERAVYALLSGETEPAYKVCRSWDEYLYVFYNHILLSRYRSFCSQFSKKLTHSPLVNVPYVPEPMDYNATRLFLDGLKTHDLIGMEARNPYHTIQAAILGKNFDSFFLSTAYATSKINKAPKDLHIIPNLGVSNIDGSAIIAVRDKDALRIIAHLYIITRNLSYLRSDTSFYDTVSLNVIAYIESLQQAELIEWIPLYASFLPSGLVSNIITQVLIGVSEPREMNRMAKLLEKHDINIEAVQESLCDYVLHNTPKPGYSSFTLDCKAVRDREKKDMILMPVIKKFAGKKASPQNGRLIRCLEWYSYLEGHWSVICRLVGYLYKRFYGNGMLLEARELSEKMNLSEVSQKVLGYDIRQAHLIEENGLADASIPPSPSKSPSKKQRFRRSLSQDERSQHLVAAELVLDLEYISWAYSSLDEFQEVWEQLELNKNAEAENSEHIKELKERLQYAIEQATEHTESLLDKDYGILTNASSPEEEKQLEYIRKTYFPDIVLNYLTALYYSSLKLSRGLLVRSMELIVLIAEDNNMLDCFIDSHRMTELADAMALASAAMINAPMPKGRKKTEGVGQLDIWNITTPKEGEEYQLPAAKWP
ncbi:putative nuclear pore complex protein Nup107 [Talaromyces proteolyticus]|uniref:Nuclear pore complex protein n=1 Tax=Talaromyces proteolyticus TaxID=1131652 RepID=A0AAD4PY40_9EURO|nr:putative nuclear pore complex protein Nup107 [Talaromyces proteolyticus]KAH8697334.1 putative nuclear pore complex protein Nup107 [Talaromyces proteolyticus]